MGSCCSSGRAQSERTPVYFYCPPVLDEHVPLPFSHNTASTIPSGVLVDTNLDTSSPDTYRAPPPPLPYDVLVDTLHSHGLDGSATCDSGKNSQGKSKDDRLLGSPNSTEKESAKLGDLDASILEEDTCPICLEEYDKENPRILTKCEHHFHLSCILEWMERSDTCPMCDKVVVSLANNFDTIQEDPAMSIPIALL